MAVNARTRGGRRHNDPIVLSNLVPRAKRAPPGPLMARVGWSTRDPAHLRYHPSPLSSSPTGDNRKGLRNHVLRPSADCFRMHKKFLL